MDEPRILYLHLQKPKKNQKKKLFHRHALATALATALARGGGVLVGFFLS